MSICGAYSILAIRCCLLDCRPSLHGCTACWLEINVSCPEFNRPLLTGRCSQRLRHGDAGEQRWKGLTWGMMPLLGGALCACTHHMCRPPPPPPGRTLLAQHKLLRRPAPITLHSRIRAIPMTIRSPAGSARPYIPWLCLHHTRQVESIYRIDA